MPTYYCNKCANELKMIDSLYPTADDEAPPNFSGTGYQLGKFVKHTIPANSPSLISIFDDPEFKKYEDQIVDTSVSGCCEIDDHGRTNLILHAGYDNGSAIKDGRVLYNTNGIKVVIHDDEYRIHAFPVDVGYIPMNKCIRCGADLLS
ncbi:MAG: hypothetical protein KA807_19105 [Prolixibacteraceae bacterium]|nr:hypothetical protein [Prolixibacteraceae bacterium]